MKYAQYGWTNQKLPEFSTWKSVGIYTETEDVDNALRYETPHDHTFKKNFILYFSTNVL